MKQIQWIIQKINREHFQLTEIIFGEIGPVVGAEQKFCLRFFHISGEILASVDNSSSVIGDNVDRNPDKQMFDQVVIIF